ncbi:MAG: hypothetical protein K2Y56_09380 [Methylobacterium sp.]|uniref:hypothetical protein n=1 Tax=Methylobacterium sp. TaxID=409 RepID=UPI0025D5883F|nr:hypothetical protein [Methylobacterium sp.]MBX9931732.1 hypothetical protein [Methylobacterium sp.]
MSTQFDGFYAGYLSSISENALTLLIFKSGVVAGTDGSADYDGAYKLITLNQTISLNINVFVHQSGTTILGQTVGPEGLRFTVDIHLPTDFMVRDFIEIKTQFGPINARFKKIRNLGSLE